MQGIGNVGINQFDNLLLLIDRGCLWGCIVVSDNFNYFFDVKN